MISLAGITGVTIDGFRFGGLLHQSGIGIASTTSNGLTIGHDSFDGFSVAVLKRAVRVNVSVMYNLVTDPGAGDIKVTGATNSSVHDNVVLPFSRRWRPPPSAPCPSREGRAGASARPVPRASGNRGGDTG